MAWSKPTKITSWSFSRYSTYKQCPFKAKLKFLEKLAEPGSPAMARGDAIHKEADAYVKGLGRTVPKTLSAFTNEFKGLRAAKKKDDASVIVEDTWAFRRDWSETTWNDWNGCWLRVKLDVAKIEKDTVEVIDHKTGKFSPQYNLADYMEQLELYALAALTKFKDKIGDAIRVKPKLWFIDQKIVHPEEPDARIYTAEDREPLRKTWEARVKPMLSDTKFAPKPSNMCRFCHFRKENGGPCVY